jgi:hypothetical protein
MKQHHAKKSDGKTNDEENDLSFADSVRFPRRVHRHKGTGGSADDRSDKAFTGGISCARSARPVSDGQKSVFDPGNDGFFGDLFSQRSPLRI